MASKKNKEPKVLTVLDQDFWAAAEMDTRKLGDIKVDVIHEAVGEALSCWEEVEEAVSDLFLALANPRDNEMLILLKRIFGSIPLSSTRWNAIEAAAELSFKNYWATPIGRTRFGNVKRAVLAAGRRRNELAHGRAAFYTVYGEAGTIVAGAYLQAPEYNTDRNNLTPQTTDDILGYGSSKYRYTSSEILSIAENFRMLRNAIWDYTSDVRPNETGLSRSIISHLGLQI